MYKFLSSIQHDLRTFIKSSGKKRFFPGVVTSMFNERLSCK